MFTKYKDFSGSPTCSRRREHRAHGRVCRRRACVLSVPACLRACTLVVHAMSSAENGTAACEPPFHSSLPCAGRGNCSTSAAGLGVCQCEPGWMRDTMAYLYGQDCPVLELAVRVEYACLAAATLAAIAYMVAWLPRTLKLQAAASRIPMVWGALFQESVMLGYALMNVVDPASFVIGKSVAGTVTLSLSTYLLVLLVLWFFAIFLDLNLAGAASKGISEMSNLEAFKRKYRAFCVVAFVVEFCVNFALIVPLLFPEGARGDVAVGASLVYVAGNGIFVLLLASWAAPRSFDAAFKDIGAAVSPSTAAFEAHGRAAEQEHELAWLHERLRPVRHVRVYFPVFLLLFAPLSTPPLSRFAAYYVPIVLVWVPGIIILVHRGLHPARAPERFKSKRRLTAAAARAGSTTSNLSKSPALVATASFEGLDMLGDGEADPGASLPPTTTMTELNGRGDNGDENHEKEAAAGDDVVVESRDDVEASPAQTVP